MIIYCAILPDKKKYIGCTTAPLKRRVQEHMQRARRDVGSSFHRALKKFKYKVEWKVLRECSSKEEMFQAEKNFIRRHRSNNPEYGYNKSIGGEFGHCGHVITEKRREASRSNSKRLWKEGKLEHLKRPLMNLNTGEVYESVSDASRKLGVTIGSVITCVKKKLKVKDCYLADYKKGISRTKELKKLLNEVSERQKRKKKIFGFKVKCLNNGKIYDCYPDAAKDLNVSASGICLSLQKNRPLKGLTFEKVKEDNEHKTFKRI